MNARAALEGLYGYFDNLAEGIAVLDPEGNIVSMNGTAARVSGLKEGEKPHGRLEDLTDAFTSAGDPIPVEQLPAVLALRGRFVRNFEAGLRPKGAQEITFVEISTAPVQGPDDETAQVIVSYREVGERRQVGEARARLVAIVESSEDAIIGKDLNGVVTAWNKSAEKLFGYPAGEMLGQSVRRLLIPGQEAEEDENLRRIARGELVRHSEASRRKKNGQTVQVSATISPIHNDKGEIVGASTIMRDITESMSAANALRESQQRLSGILDSAMDAIITVDEQQRVVLFNTAAERMFLCSQTGALGESLERFIPARFRSYHSRHIRNFAETGMTSRAMGELGSLWALRSNGEEFQIEASISQIEFHERKLFTVILRDVTERMRAQESLREQAELLKASQMIARDMQSRIVFWPLGAEKMYGYTEREAFGAVSHELFHTEFPEPLEEIEEKLLGTGRWEGELVHKRRDGSTLHVSTAWVLHRDRAGTPVRILESVVDITARKKADEKLRIQGEELVRQAEELASSRESLEEKTLMLQSVLDSMAEGLVAVDGDGNFILWNPAAEKIVGMGSSDVPAPGWTEHFGLFLPDAVTPFPPEQNPLALAAKGQAANAVIFARNQGIPNGAFLEVYANPLKDKNGTVRGGVTAFRDVTERMRAEEKARQLEERFTKAFQSSPAALAIATRQEGRLVEANAAFLKMVGYEANELVGRTDGELRIWALEEQHAEAMERLNRNGKLNAFEAQFRTKSGEIRSVNLSIDAIVLDGVECTLTTGSDVTETRSLERQLHQSLKMEALGQLTGGIAHDFNNLLGVVVGNLDLLERMVAWNEAAVKRVQTALRAAGRGAELTRRLLAFSRKEQLNPAPVPMQDAIREVVELAARTIGPEIKITTHCDTGLPPVFVDAAGLETALLNLALNARDAMPKGGALIIRAQLADLTDGYALVKAGELEPGKFARITVCDSGHGMPREVADRAFEPFFTTKAREKGTGLGLAMVYGFVKQSGGAIRIYSEVGFGTTVSIYLPLAGKQDVVIPEPVNQRGAEMLGGTALLVDDEADLLDIADAYLADLGYTVIRAGNGAEALEALARAGEIDLMVTDIIMPGNMNGIELAQKVRELRPGIKVIYTSGFPAEALAERSGKLEGGPLLHKPYQRAEFADMVRKQVSAGSN
jgi:PAS domain S-box-containing protein